MCVDVGACVGSPCLRSTTPLPTCQLGLALSMFCTPPALPRAIYSLDDKTAGDADKVAADAVNCAFKL